MDFKFGVFLFVSAYICMTQALPSCVCTRNYQPVCGSDGITYANQCSLNCEKDTNQKDITAVRDGPCELPETCICPLNYLPVCGTDGVTYSNECSLVCESKRNPGVKKSSDGACKANVPEEPACTCTRNKKPVCGSDGTTYSNACLLNCATKNNPSLSIEHSGSCAPEKVKVVDNLNI